MTVLEYCGVNKRHYSLWKCRCDCGNEKIVPIDYLTKGVTRSCGCLAKERNEESKKRLLKETYKRAYKRHYRIFGIELIIPNLFCKKTETPIIKENDNGIVEI